MAREQNERDKAAEDMRVAGRLLRLEQNAARVIRARGDTIPPAMKTEIARLKREHLEASRAYYKVIARVGFGRKRLVKGKLLG